MFEFCVGLCLSRGLRQLHSVATEVEFYFHVSVLVANLPSRLCEPHGGESLGASGALKHVSAEDVLSIGGTTATEVSAEVANAGVSCHVTHPRYYQNYRR